MKLPYFALFALLALGCTHCPPTPDPGGIVPVSQAECTPACDNLRKLGCEEGKPTAKGATCEDVCGTMPANPAYLECATAITTCPKLQECPRP